MPSTADMLKGVTVSAVILISGAYLASLMNKDQNRSIILQTETSSMTKNEATTRGLSLTIRNIRNSYGKIVISVFGDQQSYEESNYKKLVGYKEIGARSGSISLDFPNLNDGHYVVSFFHDEDDNGELGVHENYPYEGFGQTGMRTPYEEVSYDDAKIEPGPHNLTMLYIE